MATLKTSSGEKVTIRSTSQNGEVTMDGTTYPISDTLPASCQSSMPCSASGRRLNGDLDGHEVRSSRRLNFGGALMTSGSFTMMSSSGTD